MNTNHIGINLRIYRRAQGLTQEELAQQSGVHYNTIVKLEDLTKSANPTVETLEKMGRVLGVSINNLIDDIMP